jgi:CRISPR/Cas system-associated exonuclease Cas4 (RecB family)
MDFEQYLVLKNGRTAILAGRLDMYDWKTKTIIDLKTTKFIRWQKKQRFVPNDEHILQLQCYYTMFSQIIPVENLSIVYADMSDIITYSVQKRDLSGWIKEKIYRIESSLDFKSVPKGEPSALCKYCRYQTRCHIAGNRLTDKPLSAPMKSAEPID